MMTRSHEPTLGCDDINRDRLLELVRITVLILLKWRPGTTSWAILATLVVACMAAVLLAWTVYLGGRINHPELHDNPTVTAFCN
jgi:hypothetical protein